MHKSGKFEVRKIVDGYKEQRLFVGLTYKKCLEAIVAEANRSGEFWFNIDRNGLPWCVCNQSEEAREKLTTWVDGKKILDPVDMSLGRRRARAIESR